MLEIVKNIINPAFYTILYMSVIGIFVGLFILLIRKILDKKISPHWKCIIWLLLIISLIIPIKFTVKNELQDNIKVFSLSGLAEPIQDIGKVNNETKIIENNIYQDEKITKQNEIINENINKIENMEVDKINEKEATNWKDIILNIIIPTIWFLGIVLNIILLILGSNNIKRQIKGKKYNDEMLNNLLDQCKKEIGITKRIDVILQNFKKAPSIIGIINPKILITDNFLIQNYKMKKYIIMHELSHYKRKDMLFNCILLLITILHWFNPVIWLYFKKIRQDIELATDEMVLNKLENEEKNEYGMVLIKALQVFQNENYTAKLLCVTDDDKNMERRIKMVKLSESFNKNKIIISIISLIIIIVAIILFFTTTNTNSLLNGKTDIYTNDEIEEKYTYKAFKPSFKKNSESIYDDYDFTQDMIYKDNIYHKKINNYEEYSEVKSRWNNILDMNEFDFENKFMIITAVENTSMVGLTVDSIETDDDNLYISLIHYEDGINYNEDETCISYIISRDLERNNIYVMRNFRNNEKDMSQKLQLAEKDDISKSSTLAYQYKTEEYRNLEERIEKEPNKYSYSLISPNWQDKIVEKFAITKEQPDIDFSNWYSLGDDFYSITITNYIDYLKMMNNYNVPKMTWYDFKYIYSIIVVRANTDTSIDVYDIEKDENNNEFLAVSSGGILDVTKDFRYPAVAIFLPNYRSLESSFLNIKLKNYKDNMEISEITKLSNSNAPVGEIVNKSFLTKEKIDINKFKNLETNENKFGYIKITDYSYYNELMQQYSDIRKMTEEDFKNYFVVIITSNDKENIIQFKNVTYDNSNTSEIMNLNLEYNKRNETDSYSNLVIIIPNTHKNKVINPIFKK